MKRDPKTKSLYGQELLDLIEKRVQEYCITPQKGVIQDSSMINNYLEEVRRNLLLNITQYEKSNTSMRSETSDNVAPEDIPEAQPCESNKLISEDTLQKVEDFLRELKKKDKM
ncbi:hypothetical protein H5410_041520 [Solanum commersonii]|uniref:Uncharacterized protein n=1 Tax=Solanum commersonii TaxID=4109 RepID=A0A9J5XVR7_SOLCO|nr:hypothetical protein H5410_041520 [Solanum commersonii]